MITRTMYWSHLKTYEECPLKNLWKHGWEGIDVGGGVGRPKPNPQKRSRHYAVMGIVIQRVLEDFYNFEEWKHKDKLQERLVYKTQALLRATCAKEYINWRESPPIDELEEVCINGVLGYLKTMQAHKLLGPYAKCEVPLLGFANKYLHLGGKVDFVIRRDDFGITLLDGKNAATKMGFVDPDQLRWYALCFALSYQKIPDRTGFVWYRFPYNATTGEQGVDWVTYTKRDLKGLIERAQEVREGQRKEKFEARPAYKVCKYCDFESVCPARQEMLTRNRAKRAASAKAKGLPIVGTDGPAIVEFSFGDDDDLE